jgi:hypothetical protein
MFGLGRLFRRSVGLEREYGPVCIHGIQLRCLVCRHEEFWHHRAQLHTPWATLFDVEYVNRVADCAVCARCGYVHWFMPVDLAPMRIEEPEPSPDLPELPTQL